MRYQPTGVGLSNKFSVDDGSHPSRPQVAVKAVIHQSFHEARMSRLDQFPHRHQTRHPHDGWRAYQRSSGTNDDVSAVQG
jgi:hypothetical protein